MEGTHVGSHDVKIYWNDMQMSLLGNIAVTLKVIRIGYMESK